jgi:hypothetical protein
MKQRVTGSSGVVINVKLTMDINIHQVLVQTLTGTLLSEYSKLGNVHTRFIGKFPD